MLPEQRLSASDGRFRVVDDDARGHKEAGVDPFEGSSESGSIEQHQEPGGGQHWQCKRLQDGGDEHAPDRQRHAEQCHPGCSHIDDRGHVVDRAHHRRDTDAGDGEQPHGLRRPRAGGGFGHRREQWVAGPAGCGTSEVETESEEEHGRPHEPVAEHVECGEGHVVGPDHQRDQEVAEGSGEDRNHDEEDHHGGVHREEHRVEFGRNLSALAGKVAAEDWHVLPRPGQLPADAQCQGSTQQHHHQRGEQELDADHLVIGREDILLDEGQFVVVVRRIQRIHRVTSPDAAAAVSGGVNPS